MTDPTALLLLLLDSRAPAGAHSHSGGMEAAITAGFVGDLDGVEQFCRGRLRTSGQGAAAFAAAGCQLWLDGGDLHGGDAAEWLRLDDELSARTPSEAARAASRQLGSGLRRLLRAMVPDADLTTPWRQCPAPAPHHPLVLGSAVALAGGTPELAARAAALAACTGPASAAVRLLGLDPFAVQGMLARLTADSGTWRAHIAHQVPESLPAGGAPALDLLADVHLTAEVRLFAS
jgi:urease accessory protein